MSRDNKEPFVGSKRFWFWVGMWTCALGHLVASLLNAIKYNF